MGDYATGRDFRNWENLPYRGLLVPELFNNTGNAGDGDPGLQRCFRNWVEWVYHSGGINQPLDLDNEQIVNPATVTFNEIGHGNMSGAYDIDFDSGQKHSAIITGDSTLTFCPPHSGVGNFLLKLTDGGAFNTTWAAEAASGLYWSDGGTEAPLTSGGTDIIGIYYDGNDYYLQGSIGFS